MEYLFIYGLQIMYYIQIIAVSCLVFLACSCIACLVTISAYYDFENWKTEALPIFKKIWISLSITTLILFLFPSKHTLLLMGGTYYGKKAVNTVVTSDKLEKVNTIIDLQLDKYIKELKNE